MARKSVAERLADNSVPEPNTGCVLWLGTVTRGGYGLMNAGGVSRLVHRLAYEVANGPIPDGMMVCHKCDQPSCLRHDHLFLGTHSDNMVDAAVKGRHHSQKKTHCPAGHAYSGENTIVGINGRGRRFRWCAICRRSRDAERQRRISAARTPEERAAHRVTARTCEAAYRKRKRAERALALTAA